MSDDDYTGFVTHGVIYKSYPGKGEFPGITIERGGYVFPSAYHPIKGAEGFSLSWVRMNQLQEAYYDKRTKKYFSKGMVSDEDWEKMFKMPARFEYRGKMNVVVEEFVCTDGRETERIMIELAEKYCPYDYKQG